MEDIERLIQDLQSDDLEKRYDACKQLRGESSLPEEAINALFMASNDPDPLIALAAHRTLENHGVETPAISPVENGQVPVVLTAKNEQNSMTCSYLIYLSGAALMSVITFIVLSVISMYIVGTIYPYYFEPLNYIFWIVDYLIPTVITSVIVTGIVFFIWRKPILLFGNIMFTPVLISIIIGMICAMVWQLVAIYTYLQQ